MDNFEELDRRNDLEVLLLELKTAIQKNHYGNFQINDRAYVYKIEKLLKHFKLTEEENYQLYLMNKANEEEENRFYNMEAPKPYADDSDRTSDWNDEDFEP